MELHQGLHRLRDQDIELYAISYDDTEAIADYVRASGVEFTLLSDVESQVIRRYGVLNTIVQPEDVPFYGIPFPGFFLVSEDGIIVDKLFNRHLANREGIETILDSFAGRIQPGDDEPIESIAEDDGIRITAFLRGGGGVLRVGPRRRLVVRFEMPDGLHVYGEPVPDGMVATQITVHGPDGFRSEPIEAPPTEPLDFPGLEHPLQVWGGETDFVIPVYANTDLGRALKDESDPSIEIDVVVRYQACDDTQCFIPRTHTLTLTVPLQPGVKPGFSRMKYGGATAIDMDSDAHLQRMVERSSTRPAGGS